MATSFLSPKLALDFTTASLDSRITFTRSLDTATQVNSSGYIEGVVANTPRFDYNPTTFESLGLLIEEQRTNLLTYSEAYNGNWTTNSLSFGAQDTAPDGTTSAEKLVSDAAFSAHWTRNLTVSVTSGTTYTQTIFAKAGEQLYLQIANSVGFSAGHQNFNLSTGALGTGSGFVSANIKPFGNGWYRCTVTAIATSTTATGGFIICVVNGPSVNRLAGYTGNGSDGLYAWGAQLEVGAFATSYIPTTTTPLTRNADVATITGTNFSDFWQTAKGGASVQATPSTVSGTRPLVQFDDNTANEIIALRGDTTNPELYIVDGGVDQAQLDAGTIAANTAYSLTGWWATNDCKARKDSGAVVTDTTATIPTVTQARIGSDGTNYLNGTIATINYYDSFFGQPIYTRRKNKVFPSLL